VTAAVEPVSVIVRRIVESNGLSLGDPVPTDRVTPGEYWMSVDGTMTRVTVRQACFRRGLEFRVRSGWSHSIESASPGTLWYPILPSGPSRRSSSGTWSVRGVRTGADGAQQAHLGIAFGETEALARQSHATLQSALVRQGSLSGSEMWSPEELTFTPVEKEV
jgi:hypothetical protein